MNADLLKSMGFIEQLRLLLQKELPGFRSQERLEPSTRKRFLNFKHDQPPRESAVLLLLFPSGNALTTVFIKRNIYDGVHSGQIAFPGGRSEESDKDAVATALRETEEEIGIRAADVNILGLLSPLYIPPSNFNVQPVVGFINYEPTFKPDPAEVSGVITASLDHLLNPSTLQQKTITLGDGQSIKVPCYALESEIIWGATSMILSEFLEIASKLLSPNRT